MASAAYASRAARSSSAARPCRGATCSPPWCAPSPPCPSSRKRSSRPSFTLSSSILSTTPSAGTTMCRRASRQPCSPPILFPPKPSSAIAAAIAASPISTSAPAAPKSAAPSAATSTRTSRRSLPQPSRQRLRHRQYQHRHQRRRNRRRLRRREGDRRRTRSGQRLLEGLHAPPDQHTQLVQPTAPGAGHRIQVLTARRWVGRATISRRAFAGICWREGDYQQESDRKPYGVREDLSVDRLTCRMPPMGVFRQCKRACALQVAGKALSRQGPDFTRSHNQIWSTTPLRLKKNFDADNSRCC